MKRLRDVTLGQVGDVVMKYRPFLATVVAVLLIVVLLPGRGGHSSLASGGGLTTVNPGGQGTSGAAPTGGGGGSGGTGISTGSTLGSPGGGTGTGTGASGVGGSGTGGATGGSRPPFVAGSEQVPVGRYGAASIGTAAAMGSANCDKSRGQILLPSIYAPPCVTPFPAGASNGGSTAQGVTGSTIKIVLYVPANTASTAALNGVGLTESAADQEAQVDGLVQLLEHHVELYGRKVQVVPFTSSVVDTGSAAVAESRADAIQVATQVKPFLSVGIGPISPYYDLDVAQRGVVEFSQYNWDDSTFQQTSPYLWSLYDNQHIFMALAAYIGNKLGGHRAEYAGSPLYTGANRKFGVLYGTATFTSSDISEFNSALAQYGVHINPADEVGIDDSGPTTAAQQAQTAVTKLQTDNVTSVIPLASLFGLVAGATAATKQGYFPEWIVNPVGYADADQVAELMDPNQWKHAFGMTSVYPQVVPLSADQNGVGLWEWQYHSTPPGAQTYVALAYQQLAKIFTGLELAGPNLTPATFRAGLFDNPDRAGVFNGGAATFGVDLGSHGVWPTPNYAAVSDYTEIYWSGSTTCQSQSGQNQNGCYLYPNSAKRYLWNQWPSGEPSLFKFAPTDITNFQGEPPGDRSPQYPERNFY